MYPNNYAMHKVNIYLHMGTFKGGAKAYPPFVPPPPFLGPPCLKNTYLKHFIFIEVFLGHPLQIVGSWSPFL